MSDKLSAEQEEYKCMNCYDCRVMMRGGTPFPCPECVDGKIAHLTARNATLVAVLMGIEIEANSAEMPGMPNDYKEIVMTIGRAARKALERGDEKGVIDEKE